MALLSGNQLYPKFKELQLGASALDLTTVPIRVQAVDQGAYTPDSAHDFFDDVPGGARIGTASANLTLPTIVDGVFDDGHGSGS